MSSVAAAGRSGDAARRFGSYRGELRLHGRHCSWLAHDDFPALLRGGRHLFRLCDGDDAGDSDSQVLPLGRHGHDAPPGHYGQGDARDRHDRGLRIHDGRRSWRFTAADQYEKFMLTEPDDRAVRGGVLVADYVQHRSFRRRCGRGKFARSVPALFVISLIVNIGNVARAVRDRGDQPEPRFHSSIVGHVLSRRSGIGRRTSGRSVCSLRCSMLFVRFLPMISIVEMRSLVRETRRETGVASGNRKRAMPQIFHRSTNLISRLSIYGGVFMIAIAGSRAVGIELSPWYTDQHVARSSRFPSATGIMPASWESIAAIATRRSRSRRSQACRRRRPA